MKRKIKFSFLFCIVFLCFSLPLFSDDDIISPSEGSWANYQSLVLDIPYDYQAFYSLAGENPLEFGLMYDGPVVLESDGDVVINIVIVDENYSTVEEISINYTVELHEQLDFILQSTVDPVITINKENSLYIPETVQYSLNNSDVFFDGEFLTIDDKMYFERYVPIELKKDTTLYRYVLKLGNSPVNDTTTQVLDSPISIKDWNYVSFKDLNNVTYSINNEPFMYTNTGMIYVDRSKDVTLQWKETNFDASEELYTIFLPKKPEILGIPTVPIVNTPITFYLSDSRFVFGRPQNNDSVFGLGQVFIDTIYGDAYSFFENIPIYYNGIKQGELQASFIIDKIPPQDPVIYSQNGEFYSRDDVTICFESNDPILYYIPEPKTSKTGFVSYEYKNLSSVENLDLNLFTSLESNTLTLTNTSTNAQSYEIFAYSKDFAGNNSDIVSFKVIIDPYNYYITQDLLSTGSEHLGTIDNPFSCISDLEKVLNKQNFQNFYLDGVFENLKSLTINSHIAFFCTDSTRLIFDYGETLTVRDSLLSIQGGTLEQSTANNDRLKNNTFINTVNSIFSIENCEIVLTGGINNNGIKLTDSSLYAYNSGLTVQSTEYSSGVLANNSSIITDSLRSIIVAETAIPLSLVNSTGGIENSVFISNAQYSRSIELIHSDVSLLSNTFVFDVTNQVQKKSVPAVWIDNESVIKIIEDNSFAGFTELISER